MTSQHTMTALAAAAGLVIPSAQAPAARYRLYTQQGNLLVLSGQIGMQSEHDAARRGVLGGGQTIALSQASAAARSAALNLLSVLRDVLGDDASRVQQILRLGVFIAAAPDFTMHSEIADGASAVFEAVFGQRGVHARTSIGVASLPAGAFVEVDAFVALHDKD